MTPTQLFAATALYALEPPPRPDLPSPVTGQCAEAVDLIPGEPVPASLVDAGGRVVCGAVAVPTSDMADLLAVEVRYDHLRTLYSLDTAQLEARADLYRDAYKDLSRTQNWWTRPETQRVIGFAAGLLCTGVAAYGLHEIGD